MTDRRGLLVALTTLGCAEREPGFTLDDENGSNDDPSEDGDGDGDGDTGPNDIPFELVSAGMNATGKFVALRFSEPVAPVDGIDPSDFRISFAHPTTTCSSDDYVCTDETTYWDANFYAHYYIEYTPNSNDRFEVDLVTSGMQATDVFLRFEVPLDESLCDYINYAGAYDVLFVHYSPGDIPLTSSDGELLAAIGPEWVEEPGPVRAVLEIFPILDPKIAIPCNP